MAARCLSYHQAASRQHAIRASATAPLRRLALSVLFTITTTSYQTTLYSLWENLNKRQHANERYRVDSSLSRITTNIVSISGMSITVTRGEMQCKSNDAHIPWFGMKINPIPRKFNILQGKRSGSWLIFYHRRDCMSNSSVRINVQIHVRWEFFSTKDDMKSNGLRSTPLENSPCWNQWWLKTSSYGSHKWIQFSC